MTQEAHALEPWGIYTDGPRPFGDAEISATVADMPVTVGFANKRNARRIVTCVNALAGIPIEAIEALPEGELARLIRERVVLKEVV